MKKRPIIFSFIAVAVLITQAQLAAQWTREAQIPAIETQALYLQADTLYAGVGGVLYISANAGNVWQARARAVEDSIPITAVFATGSRIIIGTLQSGVLESRDRGASWQTRNDGLTDLGALAIAAFAQRGDSLYLGTIGAGIFVANLKTNLAWTPFRDGLPSNLAWNIFSLYNYNGTLTAGAGLNASYYRNFLGTNVWQERAFAPFDPSGLTILDFIDKSGVLLAGANNGLYRSVDRGDTWEHFATNIGFIGEANLAANQSTVFAALNRTRGTYLYSTTDAGANWKLDELISGATTFSLAVYRDRLYAARLDGVWYLPLSSSAVHETPATLRQFSLGQNYPNPYNPATNIPFSLRQESKVTLKIYNVRGEEVLTVLDDRKLAGDHAIKFKATGLASGVYVYKLTSGNLSESKKMIIMH